MVATAGDLTFEDVAGVADELTQSGDRVSILKVRERLGRGSFTTVKRFLDKWREGTAAPALGTSMVPPQLAGLWAEAVKAAEGKLTVQREAVDQLAAELQAKFETFEARALVAEQQRAQAESRLADKDAELLRAQAQIEALQAAQAQTQAELGRALEQARTEREVWGLAQKHSEQKLQVLVEGATERIMLLTLNFDRYIDAFAATQVQQADRDAALAAAQNRIEQKAAALSPVIGKIEEVERLVRQVKRDGGARAGRSAGTGLGSRRSKHGDTRSASLGARGIKRLASGSA